MITLQFELEVPMVSFKNGWISRVGIVVMAAIMVEIISVIQYQRLRRMMLEETGARGRVVVSAMADHIQQTLGLVESTMRENMWDVKRSLAHPDSVYPALVRLIDDNPHVVGGCLAFAPNYYPSKGRLYEPYASKDKDRKITVSQIAGPGHDYTQNEEYQWVIYHGNPSWTDPYIFGADSVCLTTYSCPIFDKNGRIVAICGLDMDLSWLGDTLNARQPYSSSFALLLTQEGILVAGPSEKRTSRADVEQALAVINGDVPESKNSSISMWKTSLAKDPFWQVVQVYQTADIYSKVGQMRLQQMFLILLALAILAFMIERYSRNERKLRMASEEQARIGGELAAAHGIQQEMLPKTFPPFVYGSLEPAREVGGDMFDFFCRDGKVFFCVGDVSGKGVPAAMLMSVVHSLFRVVSRKEDRPSRILEAMNREICRGNDSNMFVAFFIGCLDMYSGVLNYASAGHDKPFVLSGGNATMLQAKANLPLGAFPDTRFEQQSCTLEHGTTLLLYTDGLTEARNVDRKLFGREGIDGVLKKFISGIDFSLEDLVLSLCTAAHKFAGEAPQSDDLTVLAVRFAPENLIRDQITLVNKSSEVTRLSQFVKDFFGKLEIDKKLAAGMRLGLEEAVVNVINYAYPPDEEGEVQILADSDGREVRFTIVDSGFPFDPTAVLEPDTTLDAQNRPIGGLGILLSRRLMDSISYSRQNGKNVLSLTKSIL